MSLPPYNPDANCPKCQTKDMRIARRQIEREDSDGYARVRGLRLDESQLAELESDVGAPSPTRLGIHGVCEAHAAMADVATPEAEALGIIDYRGEQQQRAEDERDNALAEVARLTAERDALAAQVTRVESLAEDWRYKGQFGWGAWQIGEGPDPEGYVMDHCASALRAALAGFEADTTDTQSTDQEVK